MIKRRLLLNYRVEPSLIEKILPVPFRPKLVKGKAIAGICLIKLEKVRPVGLPSWLGISSENTAHRIAVEWEDAGGESREGVFVPRRNTDSLLNVLAGGRIFPGLHFHSRFDVQDEGGHIAIKVVESGSNAPLVVVEAAESETFPADSVFDSLEDSSRFFEGGCIGYSSREDSRRLDGLHLKVDQWEVSPLEVQRVESSYFDDSQLFPGEAIAFDHALLMRNIPHEWHSEPEMVQQSSSFSA